MPKVKRGKPPPEGFEVLEEKLEDLGKKMRDAETEGSDGLRRSEAMWPIFQIHRERARYVWEMYKMKKISREVWDYCVKQGYADAALAAKWKRPGYEKLCCLRCADTSGTNFGTSCICRVPKKDLDEDDEKIVQCTNCGCLGCASSDK